MSDPSQQQLVHELKTHLPHFTGDCERFRHALNRHVIYTPGVQYLAETAGAWWLIDAIASHLGSPEFQAAVQKDPRVQDLHFWRLDVSDDDSAVLTARADSDLPAFITQPIPFTDFPLPKIDLWVGYDGHYFTVYLPSEH